jgi:hypothetical protein
MHRSRPMQSSRFRQLLRQNRSGCAARELAQSNAPDVGTASPGPSAQPASALARATSSAWSAPVGNPGGFFDEDALDVNEG